MVHKIFIICNLQVMVGVTMIAMLSMVVSRLKEIHKQNLRHKRLGTADLDNYTIKGTKTVYISDKPVSVWLFKSCTGFIVKIVFLY